MAVDSVTSTTNIQALLAQQAANAARDRQTDLVNQANQAGTTTAAPPVGQAAPPPPAAPVATANPPAAATIANPATQPQPPNPNPPIAPAPTVNAQGEIIGGIISTTA